VRVPEGFRIDLARRVQSRLAARVAEEPLGDFDVVVGLDVAYRGDVGISAAVAYSVREGRRWATAVRPIWSSSPTCRRFYPSESSCRWLEP